MQPGIMTLLCLQHELVATRLSSSQLAQRASCPRPSPLTVSLTGTAHRPVCTMKQPNQLWPVYWRAIMALSLHMAKLGPAKPIPWTVGLVTQSGASSPRHLTRSLRPFRYGITQLNTNMHLSVTPSKHRGRQCKLCTRPFLQVSACLARALGCPVPKHSSSIRHVSCRRTANTSSALHLPVSIVQRYAYAKSDPGIDKVGRHAG